MGNLELTRSERLFLIDALESYLSDLRMEIAGTDSLNFRNELKRQKEGLSAVLVKLQMKGQHPAVNRVYQ